MGWWAAKEKVEGLGLARYLKRNGKDYIQLTPEGWYLAKEDYPPAWKEPEIIVSADFELFIYNNYDPFIIAIVDCFGKLKANDYFIIYNEIGENNKGYNHNWCDFKTFLEILISKNRYLPDVVKYEVEAAWQMYK